MTVSRRHRHLVSAYVAAALVFLACASRPQPLPDEPTPPSSDGAHAPATNVAPAAVPLVDVTPEQFVAKMREPGAFAVLVNVWATWCDPCREEFPDLLRIRESYGPRGLRTLFLSADFEDDRDDVLDFLASQSVSFETYLRAGDDHAFIDAIHPDWGGTLPATLVLNSHRDVLLFREGAITFDELDKLLSMLFPDEDE